MWDPFALNMAEKVGEGAELTMRIGGRLGKVSGQPLDLDIRVQRLATAEEMADLGNAMGGSVAVLQVMGTEVYIVIAEKRGGPVDMFRECEGLGINPKSRQIIAVKNAYPLHPEYPRGLMVNTPGAVNIEISRYSQKQGPFYPFDANPLGID